MTIQHHGKPWLFHVVDMNQAQNHRRPRRQAAERFREGVAEDRNNFGVTGRIAASRRERFSKVAIVVLLPHSNEISILRATPPALQSRKRNDGHPRSQWRSPLIHFQKRNILAVSRNSNNEISRKAIGNFPRLFLRRLVAEEKAREIADSLPEIGRAHV